MTGRHPDINFRSDEAGRFIADNVTIGENVHLGQNVIIYPNVKIEAGAVIHDGAVLGRIPMSNRTMTRQVKTEIAAETVIGAEAIIGTNAIIYTGCHLGKNVLIGDQTCIRENCNLGKGVIIGRGVQMLYGCQIGDFTRIHDLVHLVGNMVIEEHVFMGVCIAMANDDNIFLSRFGLAEFAPEAPMIRKYAVIGSGVTLVPGVEVGMGAMVVAGAVVTKDVAPWTMVKGIPAQHFRDIPDEWRRKIEENVPNLVNLLKEQF